MELGNWGGRKEHDTINKDTGFNRQAEQSITEQMKQKQNRKMFNVSLTCAQMRMTQGSETSDEAPMTGESVKSPNTHARDGTPNSGYRCVQNDRRGSGRYTGHCFTNGTQPGM